MCVYNVSLSFSIYSSMAKKTWIMNKQSAKAKQQWKRQPIKSNTNWIDWKESKIYTHTRQKRYFSGDAAEAVCCGPVFWCMHKVHCMKSKHQINGKQRQNLIWNRKHIANIIKTQTRSLTLLKHQLLTFHADKYRLGLGSCKPLTLQ